MDITAEDFRRHYEILSDEALLEIDASELVQVARECHATEVARRGLNTGSVDDSTGNDSHLGPDGEKAPEEELVCIAEFDYLDEAELARGLLEGAEIPISLESEPGVVRLMAPAALAEQALQMLAAPLSDEELAAQAEAAAFEENDEEEEPAEE